MSEHSALARVSTASASRYLQQLCKHWAHNLPVTFSAAEGTITFPKDIRGNSFPEDAKVKLQAEEDALEVHLHASAPEQLEGLKGAVARHLDRFAFREAPLTFDWRLAPV